MPLSQKYLEDKKIVKNQISNESIMTSDLTVKNKKGYCKKTHIFPLEFSTLGNF